ncbi:MAG: KpsF/GutQ family sugar-phosphate isomerase [Deferribacteraceae bacterium]|jgi:arabinose-5-phosphate isomerase|nr:KpsF/GutQ family sugar-phosphate isomerase [Deferribacteraceae bacterium]
MKIDDNTILNNGLAALRIEKEGLERTMSLLGDGFVKAVQLIMACKGRVVITGMGKSGHIGAKIAATLASTGTPSFFMHPAEGVHGDLGMLVRGDVVVALSFSGETDEIKMILPIIKRLGLPLISITGNVKSTLGEKGDAVLDASIQQEACPMNLAPTTSTTVALALGDALAVALVHERGFKAEDFALVHPSGSLGKRLLLRVSGIWHTQGELPVVTLGTAIKDLLYTISDKKFGCTAVIDEAGKLCGIVTDGDLRRAMEKHTNVMALSVADLMSKNPKTIKPEALAVEALKMMEEHSITSIFSVDADYRPIGIIHLHDLLKAGIA